MDEIVDVELAGNLLRGKLIDVGTDFLVLYTDAEYLYVVYSHVQEIRASSNPEEVQSSPPLPLPAKSEQMSTKEIFVNASGKLIKVLLLGGTTLYGYITHVFEDYLAFQSLLYGEILIAIHHIKGIMLPTSETSPLPDKIKIPKLKTDVQEIGTLSDRLKKLTGKIVVFNLGASSSKMGKLLHVDQYAVQFIDLTGVKAYLNLQHVKTVHLQN